MLGILSAKIHQSTLLHGFPPSVERMLLTNSKYCSLQAVPEAPNTVLASSVLIHTDAFVALFSEPPIACR
jgi:hypothetical protein